MSVKEFEECNSRIMSAHLPLSNPIQIYEDSLNSINIMKSQTSICFILAVNKLLPLKLQFINEINFELIVYASIKYKIPNSVNNHEKIFIFGKQPKVEIKAGENNKLHFTSHYIYLSFESNMETHLKFYVAFGKNRLGSVRKIDQIYEKDQLSNNSTCKF